MKRNNRPRRPVVAPVRRVAGRPERQVRTEKPDVPEQTPASIHRIGVSLKWLVGKAAGAIVGAGFIAAATNTLSNVGGWETSLRVGAVTAIPLLLMLQIGPRITTGFSAASPLAKYLRVKFTVVVLFGILALPGLFVWTGNPNACWHAFYGGAAGLAVGFLGFLVFMKSDRRGAAWILDHRRGWRFFYRAVASASVTLGVLVGLALV
ncbi:hypothetical protein ABZ345_03705 [Lentzea sp. NPDC005914]|uniref:hypothetical protein n=1 Tax=Lentzea sp. NPDC005914 TaxID=3154572 RepID=UPI003410CDD8